MALLLSLETSTRNCSVALSEDSHILAMIEQNSDQYIHSEKLHVFIKEVFHKANKQMGDLQAVAVGKGPGSYTGLRIGVSAAKGLCYALDIPLISEDGLSIMTREFLEHNKPGSDELIIPMIDARRMEVYTAIYDSSGKCASEIKAQIVDENTFAEIKAAKIHLIGDGAAKCKEVLKDARFALHPLEFPSAKALAAIAAQKFKESAFEDVAYFEPFYLKDFVAGKPRKLL